MGGKGRTIDMPIFDWSLELRDKVLEHIPDRAKVLMFILFFSSNSKMTLSLCSRFFASRLALGQTYRSNLLEVNMHIVRNHMHGYNPNTALNTQAVTRRDIVQVLADVLNLLVSIHHRPSLVLEICASDRQMLLHANPEYIHILGYANLQSQLDRVTLIRYLEERLPYDHRLFQIAIRHRWDDVIAMFICIHRTSINFSTHRINNVLESSARFVLKNPHPVRVMDERLSTLDTDSCSNPTILSINSSSRITGQNSPLTCHVVSVSSELEGEPSVKTS